MAIKKKKQGYYLGIFVILIFITFTCYNWPLLDNFDSYLFRAGSKLIESDGSNINNVVLIDIDYQAFRKSSQESTSPGLNLTELAKRLTGNGVKLIAFSSIFEVNQSSV